jgi:hypothetical protein
MVSFDVESLFTNIPTTETINIILDRAFPNSETLKFEGMKRETLKKLLIICTQESHFQFNGRCYEQIDGVYSVYCKNTNKLFCLFVFLEYLCLIMANG